MKKRVALAAVLAASCVTHAQPVPPDVAQPANRGGAGGATFEEVRGDEITDASVAAVERGLRWLAETQRLDGSFGGNDGTAVASLAAIAFMSAGHMPGRGEYGDVVARATDYVLANSEPSGLLVGRNSGGNMYHHGFATLLLAEIYGMTGDDRVQEPLRRAIRLIEQSQNHEGGWRYQPVPVDADVSVTILQVMALRAARDAGIKVEARVIDDAVAYVRACQNPDGGFNYMPTGGRSSLFPRSAAGVATLYYAGISEGPEIDSGLAYLMQHLPGRSLAGRDRHYFYGQYYAAQAMFLAGGDYWATWFPAVREELLQRQSPGGQWQSNHGEPYGTAMALIVLQMPNRYLPVFSGKGPGS